MTNVVFYDGLCGLCERTVEFLIRIDKKERLHFSPLQDATAQKCLSKSECQNLDSIVFLKDGRKYKKSRAILQILWEVGGLWKCFSVFIFVPRLLRDWVYDFIATHRSKF